MRAAWYERNGPARDVIEVGDIPTPDPGPGEVRVKLRTSGVNPSDVKNRGGWRGRTISFPRVIPHSDGAGVIDAVGEGVPRTRLGERVWTYNAQWRRPFGTAAEYVVLPSAQAVRLPENIDFAEGSCLGIPTLTAHRSVFADGPVRGLTVLVSGGAGAVGHYAVQLARWGGATVITTVSSSEKAERARAAGASHVVNYRTENVVERVRDITAGEGVDRIVEVEFGGDLATDLAVLRSNGVIAAYGSDAEPEPRLPFYSLISQGVTVHYLLMYILPEAALQAALADITACLEGGVLQHAIARRFPLEETAAAHEAVESHQMIGNVVVDID